MRPAEYPIKKPEKSLRRPTRRRFQVSPRHRVVAGAAVASSDVRLQHAAVFTALDATQRRMQPKSHRPLFLVRVPGEELLDTGSQKSFSVTSCL